ncbi:hypothetical protein KSC_109010 [Ktedonobacter sp. SOSP1-52]|uniref:transposase n=1 Tax=Ktedonobacter sp. SOSP1-52 TaxID=2778366 RepID=UPI001916B6BB|nr:transposase [Ktedonobacter sp. SOSP1-52]GHO72009.1 hypothetical protein KSC_109010 [Ktedonobacter sp. SOSP1-52]
MEAPLFLLVNWIDFLQQLEEWIPQDVERVYAVLDNLSMHRAMDVLLFNVAYPRWEFVFQPTYAAYLNLIEPWWKTLKSLALKGRRFETCQEIEEAVQKATAYWNARKHPYVWGRRRRHRHCRKPGSSNKKIESHSRVATLPSLADVSPNEETTASKQFALSKGADEAASLGEHQTVLAEKQGNDPVPSRSLPESDPQERGPPTYQQVPHQSQAQYHEHYSYVSFSSAK